MSETEKPEITKEQRLARIKTQKAVLLRREAQLIREISAQEHPALVPHFQKIDSAVSELIDIDEVLSKGPPKKIINKQNSLKKKIESFKKKLEEAEAELAEVSGKGLTEAKYDERKEAMDKLGEAISNCQTDFEEAGLEFNDVLPDAGIFIEELFAEVD